MYWILGWYQINQGLGYIAEHLNSNGNYEIRIKKDLNSGVNGLNVVYCSFQSRHSNSKKYDVFIHYTPGINDYSAILGWKCSCLSGRRTCSCSFNVAALIYYLAFGKNQENPVKVPGGSLNNLLISTDDEINKIIIIPKLLIICPLIN